MKIRQSLISAVMIFLGMGFTFDAFGQDWQPCEQCASAVGLACQQGLNSPCGNDPYPPSTAACIKCWNDQCLLLNQQGGQNSVCMYQSNGKWYSCCPIASFRNKDKRNSPSM